MDEVLQQSDGASQLQQPPGSANDTFYASNPFETCELTASDLETTIVAHQTEQVFNLEESNLVEHALAAADLTRPIPATAVTAPFDINLQGDQPIVIASGDINLEDGGQILLAELNLDVNSSSSNVVLLNVEGEQHQLCVSAANPITLELQNHQNGDDDQDEQGGKPALAIHVLVCVWFATQPGISLVMTSGWLRMYLRT